MDESVKSRKIDLSSVRPGSVIPDLIRDLDDGQQAMS
jgi:hypothetical protein